MSDYVLVCTQEILPSGTCEGVTSWVDMSDIKAINPLTEFDQVVFGQVNGIILISFLTGHFAGRFVKWMGWK